MTERSKNAHAHVCAEHQEKAAPQLNWGHSAMVAWSLVIPVKTWWGRDNRCAAFLTLQLSGLRVLGCSF